MVRPPERQGQQQEIRALRIATWIGPGPARLYRSRTAIVTRVIAHRRPWSSSTSTSHTHVVRPRWRRVAVALIAPSVIGRRKLVLVGEPDRDLALRQDAAAVPHEARLSAIAAYTPPWIRPVGCWSCARDRDAATDDLVGQLGELETEHTLEPLTGLKWKLDVHRPGTLYAEVRWPLWISLPADQRAVLELVLQRGRNYDQIARLLSVDRAGVRQRALAAFDALGPRTATSPPSSVR